MESNKKCHFCSRLGGTKRRNEDLYIDMSRGDRMIMTPSKQGRKGSSPGMDIEDRIDGRRRRKAS